MSELDESEPRQRAYAAVQRLVDDLDDRLPQQPVTRNAMIWQAVGAALAAYEDEPS